MTGYSVKAAGRGMISAFTGEKEDRREEELLHAASPLICVFSEGNVRVVYGGDGKSAGLCTRAVCNYACVFERE